MVRWGIQVGLFQDFEGIKIFFILRTSKFIFNKQKILKRVHVVYPKGLELNDPTDITEVPTGKILEPEDIESGNFELDKPLEPEDIGDAEL